MKQTVHLIVAAIAANSSIDPASIENIIAGLLKKIIQEDNLPEIQKCMTNTEQVETLLLQALEDITKGDLQDIIKGVEEIVTLV